MMTARNVPARAPVPPPPRPGRPVRSHAGALHVRAHQMRAPRACEPSVRESGRGLDLADLQDVTLLVG